MNKSNRVNIENPVQDVLTAFLKESAQKMLQIAIEQEVNDFIAFYKDQRLEDGRQRVVKNGYLPERGIHTGIGTIKVEVPRTRDRSTDKDKIIFNPWWIPRHMRRTATLDVWLPILYLKGISTGDFQRVLEPLLGKGASNISPSVISRLKSEWLTDYQMFLKRDLVDKRYVYWWVDGIYLSARMEGDKTCMLVIIGADEQGNKELVGLIDGFRESKDSWLELLQDLKLRGLENGPKLAIGDGNMGFWGALSEIYPTTKWQRCWVHKTRNVLDKLPKTLQSKAKSQLHEIYFAPTIADAAKAFNKFIDNYKLKYPRASECLEKDKEALLTFYSFPAEHWQSIRTTNVIESTFATVRHRTIKSKNCFSRDTIIASVFKLLQDAQKRWKKLYGHHRLAEVINLVKFVDGIQHNGENSYAA
jgi:transposase-like protein